jgi:hypothetical protein
VHAKTFYNSSTIFPHRLPDEGRQNLSTIFLQFFHNFSLLAVYPSEETMILQQFCGKIVEEFGACQIRGRIFLTVADKDFARKSREMRAGNNRRKIVE